MEPSASNHRGVSIKVRGLRKSYEGREVLSGLDFDVKPA